MGFVEGRAKGMISISVFYPFLFALAVTIPFLGKGLIGVVMGATMFALTPFIIKKFSLSGLMNAKEAWLFGALSCAWFVSGYLGMKPEKALSEWAQHSGMIIGGFLIYAGLSRVDFSFEKLYRYCGVLAAFFSSVIIINIMLPFLPDDFISNSYASVLAILTPFLLCQWVMYKRLSDGVIVFLTMLAVFALGGRTGWAALLIAVVLFIIFFPWKIIEKRNFLRLICTGLFFVSGIVGIKLYECSVDTVMYESRVSDVNMDRPASGRLDIWGETLKSVDENPWFGVGIKGFRELNLTTGPLHAHNAVIEVLIDTGIIGLIFLAAAIVEMVIRFILYYCQTSDTRLCAMVFPIFISCVAYGTASMALTSFFHAWWFLYCVALLILLRLATDRLKASSIN